MKLKHQYALSIIGVFIFAFGMGWMTIGLLIKIPMISTINAFGFIMMGLGLAITIKTLSTIKKIDLIIEEIDEDE